MLFPTNDNLEHLAMMSKILGQIPNEMALKTNLSYFNKKGQLIWNEKSSKAKKVRKNCDPLHSYSDNHPYGYTDPESWRKMFDLISKMLVYEPSKRITLNNALDHSFFNDIKLNYNKQ